MKSIHRLCLAAALVAITLPSVGCFGSTAHKAPILVAQAGLATAKIIGELSDAGKKLNEAAILPPAINLGLQERLLELNTKMRELPPILRKVELLQQAGDSTASETDRAIAILTVIGQEISIVVGGVPMSDITKVLVDLVKAAQASISTVLVEVGKIKGREQ